MGLSPGAVPPSKMNKRQWSTWATAQSRAPQRDVKRFTPTWTGFSADPSEIEYTIGVGEVTLRGGSLGSSSTNEFYFEFLPEEIRPSVETDVIALAHDNGVIVQCRVDILTNGTVIFYRSNVAAAPGPVSYPSPTTWTAAGQKGIVGPIKYPL